MMKRVYSFLFLVLMLLNTIGYYEVLIMIEEQDMHHAIDKIDQNEDEISGNLLLKIPMPLPYRQDDDQYTRAYGKTIYEGQVYHYVKRKFYQDTLYIVCLRDTESTKVRNAISDYSKSFADQHSKSEGKHKTEVAPLAKLYMLWSTVTQSNSSGWTSTILDTRVENLYSFSGHTSIFHPPCQQIIA